MLLSAEHAVFFGGAGVSTDSGLADFRSAKGGLYNQPSGYGVSPEEILTPAFYEAHPAEFFDYYRTKLLNLAAPPNSVHRILAELEARGLIKCVITQNADNLHQRAGSRNVIDIHGNVYINTCPGCGSAFARGGGRLRGSAPLRRVRRHHPPRHPALRRDPGHAPHHGCHPRAQKRGPANNRRHFPQGQQRAAPARPLPRAHGHNKRRAHAL